MSDHSAILTRLAELRATAEAATPGPWRTNTYGIEFEAWSIENHRVVGRTFEVLDRNRLGDTRHIATWDPAAALRWISWAEDVARRHGPGTVSCVGPCRAPWPCPTYAGLAGALGLEETR